MSTSEWITILGIAAGLFVTTIGSVWHLSNRFGALSEKVTGSLTERINRLENSVDRLGDKIEKIDESIGDIRIEIAEMQVKLDILWRRNMANSNSPIVLNESGLHALEVSKIGVFANDHYLEIISRVRSFKPANAYQAQELLISLVNRYKKIDEYRLTLQEAAFTIGYDIDSLLFVAALSIRDRVISDLNFSN